MLFCSMVLILILVNLDGKTFESVEQFVQYQKAIHTGDVETACGILNSDDPVKQHEYGKKLKPTKINGMR